MSRSLWTSSATSDHCEACSECMRQPGWGMRSGKELQGARPVPPRLGKVRFACDPGWSLGNVRLYIWPSRYSESGGGPGGTSRACWSNPFRPGKVARPWSKPDSTAAMSPRRRGRGHGLALCYGSLELRCWWHCAFLGIVQDSTVGMDVCKIYGSLERGKAGGSAPSWALCKIHRECGCL